MLNIYKKQILAIAKEHGVTEDVARDMFIANVEKGAPIMGLPWYDGADGFNYESVRKEWLFMSVDERAKACVNYKLG